ncbi:MAG TPA: hypothetical protein V6D17_17060, partial [Candidatus Obscuribacterales bacterium]
MTRQQGFLRAFAPIAASLFVTSLAASPTAAQTSTDNVPLRGLDAPPSVASPGQAAADKEPIKLKSAEMLKRYLEDLAARHSLTPPGPGMMTRQDLGKYFLDLMPKLANLPADQLSGQDLRDIGMLTDEFEDAMQQVKGSIALRAFKSEIPDTKSLNAKMAEASSRLAALEKLKINGDFTFAPQSDMGKQVHDSMTANLRARINFLAKVHEATADSRLGNGYLFARLTAAAGRFFPRNQYLMSPLNDIVDANASPFNSGPNEVQVDNLVINNNNSNSLRPTVSLEQCYYSQDLRPGGDWKANYKAGL